MHCADDHREEGCFNVELAGTRYHVPRFCPHRGGRLDHGQVNALRMTVTCPLHHSVFSLLDGRQLTGPACGRLAVSTHPAPPDDSVDHADNTER